MLAVTEKKNCCRKNMTKFRPFSPFFPPKGNYGIVLTDPEEHRSCSGLKLRLLCQEEDAELPSPYKKHCCPVRLSSELVLNSIRLASK